MKECAQKEAQAPWKPAQTTQREQQNYLTTHQARQRIQGV